MSDSGADAGGAENKGWPVGQTATDEPVLLQEIIEDWEEQVGEALPRPQEPKPKIRRFFSTFRYGLSLEVVLYGLLIGVAIFSRFYDLDYRALHHDEGVHAFYSWKFFDGQGYAQEPWKHGPFLYHITALVFWLFGDSDQTARISTALFGVLICLLPALLRKELGRWGALTATFLLVVSPMFLYYSRFLREDIFTAFATLGLFIGLVRFLDRPGAKWWYGSMLSLALLFCTKEVSFFYLALFGGFLGAWLCWQLAPRLLLILGGYGVVALLVFSLVIALYPPPAIPFEGVSGDAIGQYVGQLLVHPVFWAVIILGIIGLVVFWFAFREVAANRRRFMVDRGRAEAGIGLGTALFAPYRDEGTVAYAVDWLGRHRRVLWTGLGTAFAFYFVFYTGFFSDIPQGSVGLFSGLWYWMAQQGVARGSQPWFYYFFMMPLYEPLALALGTLAGGFILYKAFKFGFNRPRRTVLMTLSEFAETQPKKRAPKPARVEEEDEDELDDLSSSKEEALGPKPVGSKGREQKLSQVSMEEFLPENEMIEVEVAMRPAGNALWPGRRRREQHPYLIPLFMVVWAFGSLAIYTWASEKMPWLTVQVALPFIILAAWLMDGVWGGIEQYFLSGEHRQIVLWKLRGGTFFWFYVAGLTATAFLGYMIMLNLTAAESKISIGLTGRLDWVLVWIPPVIALLFFTALFSFMGVRIALKATLAVTFGLLTLYLVHTGFTYAFDHGDVALEMGIYVQTTPDVYRVVKDLDTVTTILPEQKNTPILYDDELRTPLDFYLRHYSYKQKFTDLKNLTPQAGSALGLNDFSVIMISDSKVATLDESQKKILSDGFIQRHYTFNCWFDESQYRNFDNAPQDQIAFLQGKASQTSIKDADNKIVLNKGETMTTEKLQQLAGTAGVLDKIYNANGGNSTLLHLKDSAWSLYQLGTPSQLSGLWRYVVYREQIQPLGCREWSLYIKKDIAGLWRQYRDLVDQPISRPQ